MPYPRHDLPARLVDIMKEKAHPMTRDEIIASLEGEQ